jgi:DNA-binding NarL/FixJ family response regulator
MRFYEISSGMRMPVNEEEQALLDRAAEKHSIHRSQLSEREQEVARLMVSRGLLNRGKDDEGIYYTPNTAADLWRY